MRTLTLEVKSLNDTLKEAERVMEMGEITSPRIAFESPSLLWKVLTAERWELLCAMHGARPMTIKEVAQRVKRDINAVHNDVMSLLNVGILDKTDDERIVFPYDAIHVDFILKAA